MNKIIEKVYFHREKEENWEIMDELSSKGFKNTEDILYLGYEVEMEVEIQEDCKVKVLKIAGIDVSDKDISI